MKYNFLGKSGLKVSALSYGAWVTFHAQADEQMAYKLMTKAFDSGVNFFDNAEAYADGMAEVIMGKVLKRTQWKRSEYVVSTKIFWGGKGLNERGLSYKHIIEGTNAALKRLQLDYVDLIFCHRPDIHTPIEETVWAMNQVIKQGKAFYWGTSEWSAQQIRQAYDFARQAHLIPPLMEQPQYNLFERNKVEKEFAQLYTDIGLGTTIWSPLASGLLTGKYTQGIPKGSRLDLPELEWLKNRMQSQNWKEKINKVIDLHQIANEIGATLPQLALAWCLKNPNVSTVITGASKLEQMSENMKAINFIDQLDQTILDKIENIMNNKPSDELNWRQM